MQKIIPTVPIFLARILLSSLPRILKAILTKKTLIGVTLLLSSITNSFASEIAVTFDDLPYNKKVDIDTLSKNTHKLLETLTKFNVPTIGFVNEGMLYTSKDPEARIAMLKLWIGKGHELGNHTYSHISLHKTTVLEYQKDVIAGHKITKNLMNEAEKKLRYFRPPYLHTGQTPEISSTLKKFLTEKDYILAPVTIDTDDWKFDDAYTKAKNRNNKSEAKLIIKQYLDHTKTKFEFYEKTSNTLFGRNIRHIWLLHVNQINADCLPQLLEIVQKRDYNFITLEKALEDPAYQSPDTYHAGFGVAWLYRWDISNKKLIDWKKEPEPVGL